MSTTSVKGYFLEQTVTLRATQRCPCTCRSRAHDHTISMLKRGNHKIWLLKHLPAVAPNYTTMPAGAQTQARKSHNMYVKAQQSHNIFATTLTQPVLRATQRCPCTLRLKVCRQQQGNQNFFTETKKEPIICFLKAFAQPSPDVRELRCQALPRAGGREGGSTKAAGQNSNQLPR